MMVLFLIGLMALIGAGLMIISGIQAIISLGIARGILVKRCIMSLRDYLYLLGVMVLIFAAGVTGRLDYLGHMLDGAVIMFLYLKGKEKL